MPGRSPEGRLIGTLPIRGWVDAGADNDRVYYHRRRPPVTEFWSIPSAGGAPTMHGVIPNDCARVAISYDGRTAICAEYSDESDIWLVENFDPRPE